MKYKIQENCILGKNRQYPNENRGDCLFLQCMNRLDDL